MAIRQDFILRMIEQLAEAFGRIFAGDKVDDEQKALFEIEGALAKTFRTRRELLFMNPEDNIEEFDPRLSAEVGRMFLEHARLSASQGQSSASERSYALGIKCLRNAIGEDLSHSDQTSTDLMRELLRSQRITTVLSADDMAETWRDIFEEEARLQHYPAAEDALFHAIDLADDPADHVRRGIRFFENLLKLPDEVLDEADLPRVEVEEALDELREE
ncbi:hypothetical protein FIV42_09385 [Persicimonas caeni]|uniref:Uncharacterized protein n=1 Tax=Persicimonas caeni TaxID=2292766 RepID=A0A4Y6PSE9_PERCE|nr:DUF6483 family protein [Persicimonas caeni]QDG50937.1 hypothetical protein FIV42_09385 [Persicimonas caeni]QED32158.1 hypothetical protein FRD00_09380 [Persicimonas caeni]